MVAASSVRIKHYAQFIDEEIKEKVNRISVQIQFKFSSKPFQIWEEEIQNASILEHYMSGCQISSVSCTLF